MQATGPDTDRQVPVHLRLDQAAQGGDQHPPHVVRQPAADAPVDAGAGRGAAGAGGLAALEPHLRRQPQLRHDALQRRHALHRRRQAGAGADGRDAAQPARDRADGLLQRAHRLRGDRQRDEDRRRAAPQPAVARADVLLCRRRAGAAGLGRAARGAGARDRRAHRHGHRPGHDRVGARSPSSSPTPTSRPATWACPRPGWSSSWCRWTARSRCATRARTSRRATGAAPEATARGLRRGRLLLHRRRRAAGSTTTTCTRA